MLTTVPVSSVSLTGLPNPNWTHLWRELLPSPWWRGVDLAGLLGMTTMPPLTEPTVELESGRTSSRSCGTMLWRPTIGLDEDWAVLAGPARPWTPACREACADLWQLCSDWPSSADELTGPLNAFSAGAPLWNVEGKLQPDELEVLTWCEVGLLEVDDPAKKLEHPDGCLGMQLSLFRCICSDQAVV